MARQADPAVRARWQTLIQQQAQSRLTIAEFCRSQSVSTASFYGWRRRLANETTPTAAFLPVTLAETSAQTSDLQLRFDCGATLKIPSDNLDALTQVLRQLAANGEADT